MKNYVLDSYALLAYFQNEAGADEVKALFKQAAAGQAALFLSTVNFGEAASSPAAGPTRTNSGRSSSR